MDIRKKLSSKKLSEIRQAKSMSDISKVYDLREDVRCSRRESMALIYWSEGEEIEGVQLGAGAMDLLNEIDGPVSLIFISEDTLSKRNEKGPYSAFISMEFTDCHTSNDQQILALRFKEQGDVHTASVEKETIRRTIFRIGVLLASQIVHVEHCDGANSIRKLVECLYSCQEQNDSCSGILAPLIHLVPKETNIDVTLKEYAPFQSCNVLKVDRSEFNKDVCEWTTANSVPKFTYSSAKRVVQVLDTVQEVANEMSSALTVEKIAECVISWEMDPASNTNNDCAFDGIIAYSMYLYESNMDTFCGKIEASLEFESEDGFEMAEANFVEFHATSMNMSMHYVIDGIRKLAEVPSLNEMLSSNSTAHMMFLDSFFSELTLRLNYYEALYNAILNDSWATKEKELEFRVEAELKSCAERNPDGSVFEVFLNDLYPTFLNNFPCCYANDNLNGNAQRNLELIQHVWAKYGTMDSRARRRSTISIDNLANAFTSFDECQCAPSPSQSVSWDSTQQSPQSSSPTSRSSVEKHKYQLEYIQVNKEECNTLYEATYGRRPTVSAEISDPSSYDTRDSIGTPPHSPPSDAACSGFTNNNFFPGFSDRSSLQSQYSQIVSFNRSIESSSEYDTAEGEDEFEYVKNSLEMIMSKMSENEFFQQQITDLRNENKKLKEYLKKDCDYGREIEILQDHVELLKSNLAKSEERLHEVEYHWGVKKSEVLNLKLRLSSMARKDFQEDGRVEVDNQSAYC